MTFKYRGTATDIALRLLDIAIGDETYATVLGTLGAAVRKVSARIDAAGDPDADADYEIELIENMLGVAYVVCQVQITAIVQAALGVRKAADPSFADLSFKAYQIEAGNLRRLGPVFKATYSKLEVLWQLGNYFKHRDEGSNAAWADPQHHEKWTVPVIVAAGLASGSTGNVRTGAEALGNKSFTNMAVFEQIIRDWSEDVRKRIRDDLGR